MKWKIEIDTNENFDSALFKVYLDIKKKTYITKKPLPTNFEKLDCECKTDIKYRVIG